MTRRLTTGLTDGIEVAGHVWDYAAWQTTQAHIAATCPRPDKTRHTTEAGADTELDRLVRRRRAKGLPSPGGTLTVYGCACGGWHVGNRPPDRVLGHLPAPRRTAED